MEERRLEGGREGRQQHKLNKLSVISVLVSGWDEAESIDVTERQQQHAVKPTGRAVWRVVTTGVFRLLQDDQPHCSLVTT